MKDDEFFIKRVFSLAKRGLNFTFPNPLVGAVIVKNGKIVGEGFHKNFGSWHAEVLALKRAKEKAKGATLYTNLEPCCHFGKTPPCTQYILKAKIKRVVFSSLDPNPKVNGKGLEFFEKAKIETKVGVLEKEAKALNESFFAFHQKGRPFVCLKFAASLDGKIATKNFQSKWITNEKARNYARRLRLWYQAVLVGANTVIKDNPHLGVREKNKKDPLRIVLDDRLKVPLESQIFRDKNLLLVTTKLAKKEKLKKLEKMKIPFIAYNQKRVSIPKLLEDLKSKNIVSVLVEGGGETIGSFFDEKLVDKIYAFYSPLIIGGKEAVPAVLGKGVKKLSCAPFLSQIKFKRFNKNFLIYGYLK